MKNYCDHNDCGEKLELCKGIEPWSIDYLICQKCDSTFCLEDNEKGENG
jgi:hypothetical protein